LAQAQGGGIIGKQGRTGMKIIFALFGLILSGLIAAGPSLAADLQPLTAKTWRMNTRTYVPPFPRSERSQAVWDGGERWTECGSYCAWGQTQCLERDSQGLCLKLTDKCDRMCQRESRTAGGPLIPFEMPWD
jgi:hypothetical protein